MRTGAAALAAALLSACAVQTSLDPAKADRKLIGAVDWLAQNSEYKTPAAAPHWVQQSRDQMLAHATRLALSGNDRNVYASYDCPAHTLYLWAGANLDDAIVTSYVLHAVVHQQQCVAGKMMEACAGEQEATSLQAKFVRDLPVMMQSQGFEPDDALLQRIEGSARRLEATALASCQQPPAK